jgi:hypothetical protein
LPASEERHDLSRKRSGGGAEDDIALLEKTPLLGHLAVAAALIDATINRVLLRALGPTLDREAGIAIGDAGGLPKNLTAVAGLVALAVALIAFVRIRSHAPLRRRVLLAGFSGVFLPTVFLATFLPEERTTQQVVLLGTGAANVLAVLVGLGAIRWPSPPALRLALSVVCSGLFASFGAIVVAIVSPEAGWEPGYDVARILRHLGEIAYLSAPAPLLAFLFVRPEPDRRRVLMMVVGSVAALAVFGAMLYGRTSLRGDFGVVLYGAQRLVLFIDSFPLAYALPIAVATGVGAAALASSTASDRQVGAGVLLLLAAGYAPKTPLTLLVMVLGVVLLSRAATALGLCRALARRHPVEVAPVERPPDRPPDP